MHLNPKKIFFLIKMEDIKTKFPWISLIPVAVDVACKFLHC